MKYIHIKNLEKYQPGYTDRSIIWIKVYLKMLYGDHEFEMLDEIDKWRFVAFCMLEVINCKPTPMDEKYLIRKGFDFQERSLEQTAHNLGSFMEVTEIDNVTSKQTKVKNHVTESRVDKSRVDKESAIKPVDNSVDNSIKTEPSADFIKIKKQVHDYKGINISMLINKFKKDQRIKKSTYEIPESVYIDVCNEILKADTTKIKDHYPYFMRVLAEKSRDHVAKKNIAEHEGYKTDRTSLKNILKEISL